MKTCTVCSESRPLGDFALNKNTRDGRLHQCRTCRGPGGRRRQGARRRPADPLKKLKNDLARYGVSVVEYRLLQMAQGDRCAICEEPETQTYRGVLKRLAVDHDHETGVVRGLLCSQCNRALGMFGDSRARLLSAIHYLGFVA